jgi:hypothetical protein
VTTVIPPARATDPRSPRESPNGAAPCDASDLADKTRLHGFEHRHADSRCARNPGVQIADAIEQLGIGHRQQPTASVVSAGKALVQAGIQGIGYGHRVAAKPASEYHYRTSIH